MTTFGLLPGMLDRLDGTYKLEPMEVLEDTLPSWALPRTLGDDFPPRPDRWWMRLFELFPFKGVATALALYVGMILTILASEVSRSDMMAPLVILSGFAVFFMLEDTWCRMGRYVDRYGAL